MVGHTGNLDAAVTAVETIDQCLGRIVKAVRGTGGVVIVTADHGNAEEMWNVQLNESHTAHTSNPVPVIVVQDANGVRLRDGGSLRDIAPTMLGILEVPAPKEMTGQDVRIL
jgi:2,3-bisphosphoglycerate-independent phosphoglycerate mutase